MTLNKNEEVDENISFKDYLNPPKHVFLYGQEKELIIKLNDGRKGIKKWKWYPDDNLDEGGEWEAIGSPGDGSVYINQRIGSLFELEEAKVTTPYDSTPKTIEEVDENISFKDYLNPPKNVALLGQEKELTIKLNDGRKGIKKWKWYPDDDSDKGGEWEAIGSPGDGSVYVNQKIGSLFELEEAKVANLDNCSSRNIEENDENISFKESVNSDLNDNQNIIDYDVNQIQDINDDSSIISIILFIANKDKYRFKPSLFNAKNNIRVNDLDLTFKTLNSLIKNNICFLTQLTNLSKNDLLKLKNFGNKSCEELISAIIYYHKEFNDKNQINENNYSDGFWNFIQENFKNIKTQTDYSDVKNIDNLLELFFEAAYEKNNNLRTLEIIYLISEEAFKKFNDSSIKKLTFEYSLYKYLIFKKFLNSKSTLSALTWIRNFRNIIERNDIFIIYLQRLSGKTLAEIGREKNMSRERIRQLESKISKSIATSDLELSVSGITNICSNLKEQILFKEESSDFLEIIKKFGRIPHYSDEFPDKNSSGYLNNYLKLNLKERIDMYEKFKVEIPSSEYEFHYEYITNLNGLAGNGYWLKLENLKEFLFRHAHKLGEPNLMPKQTSLPRAVGGVVTRHGGQSKVASLVGLKYQGQLVNPDGGRTYWTDERLEELIDDVNMFLIQDLSIMPERSQFVDFFKNTTITKYQDKRVYSVFAAFTKQEVLSWEDVAKKFKRKFLY